MAKLNRKNLKRDRFVEEVGHQVEYVSEHRNQVILWSAIALAVIIGGASYWSYSRTAGAEARVALNRAVDLFHGTVTLENRPGFVTFATTLERIRRVTEAMEGVISDYSGSGEAAGAEYYLGLLEREQGANDESRARFEAVINGRSEEYSALARLSLANLLMEEGKADEARQHFEQLVANPTRTVPRGRARVELALTYRESDPAKAREILTEVQQESGAAGILAATLIQELAEGG